MSAAEVGSNTWRDLQGALRGEVRWDSATRGLYAFDASNYRHVPMAVVMPSDTEDLIDGVRFCYQRGLPILMRGSGTSLAGQCNNVAVVFDTTKYLDRILEINPRARTAQVQPGVVLDNLRAKAKKYRLTFGPDPATHRHCVIGGMLGNNSCGVHSQVTGRTLDNVRSLEILTYDGLQLTVGRTSEPQWREAIAQGGRRGEIFARLDALRLRYGDLIRQRFPKIPRLVSGYPLDQLLPENGFHVGRSLVGTEGTCVVILSATLDLVPDHPCRALAVIGCQDIQSAGDLIPMVNAYKPMGLEGLDDQLLSLTRAAGGFGDGVRLFPEGKGWLIAEFGGETPEDVAEQIERLRMGLREQASVLGVTIESSAQGQQAIWEIREAGLGTTAFPSSGRDSWPGWEDSAVPPEHLGDYLRRFGALLRKYHYQASLYGHFGQGCVHCRINFDLMTKTGVSHYRSFVQEAADLVTMFGGSLSGEHGDGQSRAELLGRMFGDDLVRAFGEFKAIWDPRGKMNPGRVVDPLPIDRDLKLGSAYRPPSVKTHFHYPEDRGDFTHATLRCVGVGKCRNLEGGTMCPSYRVTKEEMHSTRGRAHALFEMLRGETIANGWRDRSVKKALDLCLACKGCKGECPVKVDMATYKAEFLSHYYHRRLRPRAAYAMGLIDQWARMASHVPRLANGSMRVRLLGTILKVAAGISPDRTAPRFAAESFATWYAKNHAERSGEPTVVLWVDTFSNYFHPEILRAAFHVLGYLGHRVMVPSRHLCCGRPLYDYGMVQTAKKYLNHILSQLRDQIQGDLPIVVLEPSCLSVFRDELCNLLPDDMNAKRLRKNVVGLAEFIRQTCPDGDLPRLERHAILHGHCHQKALWGLGHELQLFKQMGMTVETLDSGCCGMAGSFGYEIGKVNLSRACGERVLLPKVRQAPEDVLIITDGFSCQRQIGDETNRQALHTAQVLEMALHLGTFSGARLG